MIEKLEQRVCLSVGFSPPIHSSVGMAALITSGDFNRDGKLDLLARGDPASVSSGTRVHAGLGDGRFATAGVPVWSGPNVSAMAVADFNEDGKPDAAFANDLAQGTVTLAFGRGDGTFGPINPLPVIPQYFVGANPRGVALADFNGDDNVDMIIANYGAWAPPGSLQPPTFSPGLLLGNGDGTFRPVIKVLAGSEPHDHVAVGDVDDDGNADAVLVGPDQLSMTPVLRSAVYTLIGDGHGGFAVTRRPFVFSYVRGITVNDLNGDGRDDLAALQTLPDSSTNTNGAATLFTYTSDGSGVFDQRASVSTKLTRAAGLSAADFDRDGKLDFAVAGVAPASTSNAAAGSLSVMIGHGDGTVAPPRIFRTHGQPLSQLAADFNRDGRPDIVSGGSTGVATLLNASATAIGSISADKSLFDQLVELG